MGNNKGDQNSRNSQQTSSSFSSSALDLQFQIEDASKQQKMRLTVQINTSWNEKKHKGGKRKRREKERKKKLLLVVLMSIQEKAQNS